MGRAKGRPSRTTMVTITVGYKLDPKFRRLLLWKEVIRPLALVLTVLAATSMVTAQITTPGVDGRQVRLFDAGSSKLAVLIFVRTDCPIANRYAPEIYRLYHTYASRVTYYLCYPDVINGAVAIKQHISAYH